MMKFCNHRKKTLLNIKLIDSHNHSWETEKKNPYEVNLREEEKEKELILKKKLAISNSQ